MNNHFLLMGLFLTVLLLSLTSPAVEAAHPNGCQDGQGQLLEKDQRGWNRHLEGDGDGEERCDIGAYENGEGMWP